MQGQGFSEVYNLKGGIKAWHGLVAEGPAEEGMGLLGGEEEPATVLAAAYGLEENLGAMYQDLAARTQDSQAADLFNRLAGFEDKHKDSILAAFKAQAGEHAEPSFDTHGLTETGRSLDAMLEQLDSVQPEIETILQAAMGLEAQALDLYLRYAQVMEQTEARDTFHRLADEEKTHLTWLGRMLQGVV